MNPFAYTTLPGYASAGMAQRARACANQFEEVIIC
jgi:hypothetical protein